MFEQPVYNKDTKGGSLLIVTIDRKYGSGGRLVGEKLAKLLGYRFYDRNC